MTDPISDTLVEAVSPSRNDGITMDQAICEVCGSAFRRLGRRRFCSDACRQAAWRRRHSGRAPLPPLTDGVLQSARSMTVYECPSCGARYLGEQRCPECHLFCRRVGPGGRCPHCDEPVAIADLIAEGEG